MQNVSEDGLGPLPTYLFFLFNNLFSISGYIIFTHVLTVQFKYIEIGRLERLDETLVTSGSSHFCHYSRGWLTDLAETCL